MLRISKTEYYLKIAETVALRGTCCIRNYGVVIVKDDQVISTGYTGAPRGLYNCIEYDEPCPRLLNREAPGMGFGSCKSVHAEMNAIINVARRDLLNSTMFIACVASKYGEITKDTEPCQFCRRMIINAGISNIICTGLNDTVAYTIEDMIHKELDSYGGLS